MKVKDLPEDFDTLEAWDDLKVLIENIDKDLKKSVTKGTKRAGVNARKGLSLLKEMATDIIHGSIIEQKKVREQKPEHGNKNGKGVQAMLKSRNIDVNMDETG